MACPVMVKRSSPEVCRASPEVTQLGFLIVIEENVRWFNIAMHKTRLVQGVQPLGATVDKRERCTVGELATFGQVPRQIAAANKFKGDVRFAVMFAGLQHLHHPMVVTSPAVSASRKSAIERLHRQAPTASF